MTAARWAIAWGSALRLWKRPIRSRRDRRVYARIVLHAFRAHQRLRILDAIAATSVARAA